MQINGTRILITGGSGGIGRAIAQAMLEAGAAHVGLLARDAGKLQTAIESLGNAGDRAIALPADVADPAAVADAVAKFAEAAGGIDVLVNSAGSMQGGAVLSLSFRGVQKFPLEAWQRTLDTNLTGPFLCAQAVVEKMVRQRTGGVIVNISSFTREGLAGEAAYGASKAGLVALTRSLALELAPLKIRCVAVSPGVIDTPLTAQVPAEHRQRLVERVAAGREGRPEEVAHAVKFAVENDYFNGAVLELDGGMH